jgi:hypothetical protein
MMIDDLYYSIKLTVPSSIHFLFFIQVCTVPPKTNAKTKTSLLTDYDLCSINAIWHQKKKKAPILLCVNLRLMGSAILFMVTVAFESVPSKGVIHIFCQRPFISIHLTNITLELLYTNWETNKILYYK